MHEWHTDNSTDIIYLIKEFENFTFDTDFSYEKCKVDHIKITNRVFPTKEEAITYVTNSSYGSETAYIAAYTTKKLSKGYLNAFTTFLAKYNEYSAFKDNLTISYGRKSSRATCPNCGSSISLKYGKRFKSCPVCGSKEIISDSNWKILDTKKKLTEKASENLSKEAKKNDVTFVCGIEWHC